MKKQLLNNITTYLSIAFVLVATSPYVYAVTIVNSISVHSSTGGQVLSGANGQDGTDGQKGEDGTDGQNGENIKNIYPLRSNASVTIQSQVNGVTMFESSKKTQTNTPVQIVSTQATSVGNSVIEVQGIAKTAVVTEVGDTQNIHIPEMPEIFKTIHLIMMSYVSKFF